MSGSSLARASSRLLAKHSTATGDATDVREFLAFSLANEVYAVPLAAIREILKPPPITEVPRASRDVLGIISVRGTVTTVLDLRRCLRMHESPPDKQTRILLVEIGEEVLGLFVDRVLQVYRLRNEEIELAASVGSDTAEYVVGIGRPFGSRFSSRRLQATWGPESEMLILLDLDALLRN